MGLFNNLTIITDLTQDFAEYKTDVEVFTGTIFYKNGQLAIVFPWYDKNSQELSRLKMGKKRILQPALPIQDSINEIDLIYQMKQSTKTLTLRFLRNLGK